MNLYVTAHRGGAAYNTPAVGDGEPRCRGGEWRFWCAGHGTGGVWSAYGLWVQPLDELASYCSSSEPLYEGTNLLVTEL